ncbi:MAG: TonB-dependent receptor plug domain-containing protein [Gemmatimonadetes bacterium]|nr:TonB-dependent receptor plug domain-containing protein [Gemmatimonadota bacterium]
MWRAPALPFASLRLVALLLLLACHLGVGASPTSAQWPGEIRGRIVDSLTGRGVPGALVSLSELGLQVTTDSSGRFHLRGLEPGRRRVLIQGLGYRPREVVLEVGNGRVTDLLLEITPDALALEELRVQGEAGVVGAAYRLGRQEVIASGARSVGDLLERMPGVVVRSEGPAGRQVAIIRGATGSAVLVLLDGVPLNDPITGEVDLSEIPASTVGGVTVLPGARSARYGGRAEGGVVLIQTVEPQERYAGRAWSGALGRWGLGGEGRHQVGGLSVTGVASYDRMDGGFDYVQPLDLGGLPDRRENSDVRQGSVQLGVGGAVWGGESRALASYQTLARGLPGKSFSPSPQARQELHRGRASLTWARDLPQSLLRIVMHGAAQEAHFSDPLPPLGLPYDDRTRLYSAGFSTELTRRISAGLVEGWGGGFDQRLQRIEGASLNVEAPRSRMEVGAFGRVRLRLGGWLEPGTLSLTGRVDRDGAGGSWYGSHEVSLSFPAGPVRLHLANRSAFSPPTLGDQYFREGVGVRPNPDLRAERIPSEWEVSVSAALVPGPMSVSFGGAVFIGDVRDMIVWAPDFRFVWSPVNEDVSRSGMEGWGEIRLPGMGLRMRGTWSHARMTYDRPGLEDVQVIYRPRSSGALHAGWEGSGSSLTLETHYVGARNPVPAQVNELPGFWTTHLSVHRRWVVGGWRVRTALRIDRLLDRTDEMIFGFPEPGRAFLLEFGIGPAPTEAPGAGN